MKTYAESIAAGIARNNARTAEVERITTGTTPVNTGKLALGGGVLPPINRTPSRTVRVGGREVKAKR